MDQTPAQWNEDAARAVIRDHVGEEGPRHVLKLCRAEACQSMGSEANARRLLDALGLDWGGTTPDGRLTVEAVYCLGLCATAPGALFDDEPVGRADAATLEALVAEAA
ncbi:MAG: hypothetical protein B7Z64_04080 [Acidiphilium sp. 21-68-69]|nr:MAG: hypothetical protein B7Z64_04080 [Acidiphilium sp. 21-68-69]